MEVAANKETGNTSLLPGSDSSTTDVCSTTGVPMYRCNKRTSLRPPVLAVVYAVCNGAGCAMHFAARTLSIADSNDSHTLYKPEKNKQNKLINKIIFVFNFKRCWFYLNATSTVHWSASTGSRVQHKRWKVRRLTGRGVGLVLQRFGKNVRKRATLEFVAAHITDLGDGIFVGHG